jgi:hypothetical protein
MIFHPAERENCSQAIEFREKTFWTRSSVEVQERKNVSTKLVQIGSLATLMEEIATETIFHRTIYAWYVTFADATEISSYSPMFVHFPPLLSILWHLLLHCEL